MGVLRHIVNSIADNVFYILVKNFFKTDQLASTNTQNLFPQCEIPRIFTNFPIRISDTEHILTNHHHPHKSFHIAICFARP